MSTSTAQNAGNKAGNKKVALVTGSSRGIGFEVARALAKSGHHVVIHGRQEAEVEESLRQLRAAEAQVSASVFDVSKFSEVEAGFERIRSEVGPVDILVNNAGITRDRSFVKMSVAEWEDVIANNLNSVFYCTKLAVAGMVERRWGRVVSISSIIGQTGAFGQVNYAASKAGIIGFTKALAREVSGKGVTVNAIAPGYIKTSMTAHIPADVVEKLLERVPARAMGNPSDIAGMASYLCSDQGAYVSGAVINVDGGY